MDNRLSDRRRNDASRALSPSEHDSDRLRNRGGAVGLADAGDLGRGRLPGSSYEATQQILALNAKIEGRVSHHNEIVIAQQNAEAELTDDPVAVARHLIAASKRRDSLFRDGLFACPAWDMLMDLYITKAARSQVTVSSLTISSKVPTTTALRHIADLVEHGEVVRVPDPFDKRRCFVEISDDVFDRLTECLQLIGARSARTITKA